MTASSIRTSIIIPCFNEADGVPVLCERLSAIVPLLDRDGQVEVVFVDDGSTDGTADIIRRLASGFLFRILKHDTNKGLGAALRTGFASAGGDEVVTIDSDCTYDPGQIGDLLKVLRSGYDVVTGSPYHPNGRVLNGIEWRVFLSKALSRFYWVVLPGRLYTYTSCFRAYRREILQSLHFTSDGFLSVTQMLASAILAGLRVGEFPTELRPRRHGASKMRIVSVSIAHLFYFPTIIRQRFRRT